MLFRTLVVSDTQRGIERRNGRLVRWLEPGAHVVWFAGRHHTIELLDLTQPVLPSSPELEAIVPAEAAERLAVGADELAIVWVDGVPVTSLAPGRWLLWQLRGQVTARVYSTREVHTKIPVEVWHLVPDTHLLQVVVHPFERVVLHVDGQLHDVLAEGRWGIQQWHRKVGAVRLDLRETELLISGQDVMSKDKVSLRVNVLVRWRIVDAGQVVAGVTNVRDALYGAAQMEVRQLIAGARLDQLLEGRNEAAQGMLEAIAPKAEAWGIEVTGLDLKDLILPGEMKTILNQVIEAEKRAAANVITRREETAATRSLANTAKLLDANPTLLRLKELEAMKDLAGHVGELTVVAGADDLIGRMRLG